MNGPIGPSGATFSPVIPERMVVMVDNEVNPVAVEFQWVIDAQRALGRELESWELSRLGRGNGDDCREIIAVFVRRSPP